MSNIPKLRFKEFSGKWESKQIQNILKIGSGRDYKHLENGTIPVYGTGGYMTSVNKYLYDGESVCIGRKGTIDKPKFLNGKFWTVDTLFYTHSFNNVIPKFIYSIFQRINWKKYNEASGVPSLSKSTIEKIKISIPQKQEQQKIASFLTYIDTKIEQLNKKQQLLEEYKKAIMQKIFSQEIRFQNDDGSAFGDWEEKTLKSISEQISYGLTVRPEYIENGIPLISARELKGGKINYDVAPKISENSYNILSSKAKANKGDIFLTKTGTIGLSAYVNDDFKIAVTQNIAVIRVVNKSYNHQFILQLFKT
ncbi:MAG: restriction endonuclease subunit S, partial [Arcobacteraceae bacterium]|nr:restriction endonuclease subunit S [Arcobacteraceae bacterium]